MPPVKLSKITFPPPSAAPTSVAGGGAPSPAPPPPVADPPVSDPVSAPPVAGPPVSTPVSSPPPDDTSTTTDSPPDTDTGVFGPPDLQTAQDLELQLHAAVARVAATRADTAVFIPTELVDKVWNAVATVPGLSIASVLTMALQQFLRTLPQEFEQQ